MKLVSNAIAYLGTEGSYSHQASQEIFPDREHHGFTYWPDIFAEVGSGRASCGVVPVDNALSGRIEGIYRQLSETTLNILQEFILPVHHSLLLAGSGAIADLRSEAPSSGDEAASLLARIREVYSHPQGFLQCQHFLQKFLPHAKFRDSTDAAGAAKDAADSGTGAAAISSKVCAALYGLTVVQDGIEDEPGNATRFLVLSKKGFEDSEPTAPAITTILFRTKHEPGSLVRALGAFADRDINLTKLETYMASAERRRPTFYVDVGEHLHTDRMIAAMAVFARFVDYYKVLGTYAASPLRGVVSGFLPV